MRMVEHGQSLVLGRGAQTPSSWTLAFAAGAYLQVTSDKLQDTKKLQVTSLLIAAVITFFLGEY